MSLRQLPNPKMQFFNSSGAILSGGKVYTYIAGTTTAKATYSDSAGATPNANPIILDSRGEATIYWDGTYKVVVKDSSDVTIYTVDNHGTGSVEDVSAQRSLVLNYSFEDDTDGDGAPDNWTITLYTNGTQTLDASAGGQIHGAKALKFTSAGSGGGYAESELFLVQEDEPIKVIFATKSSDAAVRNLVEIVWYDRSQSVLSTSTLYDDSTTNPTSWTNKSASSTAPTNARFAKLRLTGCHSSDSTVGSTWFDDIRATNILDLVSWDGLRASEIAQTNSGAVTVITSTDIVTADLGTVSTDDMIFVWTTGTITKGGTLGQTDIIISKSSGTATISVGGFGVARQSMYQEASASGFFNVFGLFKVTLGGTLTLRVGGTSAGSNGTVSSGAAMLYAVVIDGV